jgi:hypothetical protein
MPGLPPPDLLALSLSTSSLSSESLLVAHSLSFSVPLCLGTELRNSSRALIFSSVVLASLYLFSLAMASAGRFVTIV